MLGGHALTAADALGAEGRMGTVRLGRIRRKEITRWVRKKTVSSVNSPRVCARARCLIQPPYRPYLPDRRRLLDRPTKPLNRLQTGHPYQQNLLNLKNRISESKKVYACARVRETLTRVHFPYRITALDIKKNPPTLPGKWMQTTLQC